MANQTGKVTPQAVKATWTSAKKKQVAKMGIRTDNGGKDPISHAVDQLNERVPAVVSSLTPTQVLELAAHIANEKIAVREGIYKRIVPTIELL